MILEKLFGNLVKTLARKLPTTGKRQEQGILLLAKFEDGCVIETVYNGIVVITIISQVKVAENMRKFTSAEDRFQRLS